jgi:WD40 repeat protein
LKQAKDQFNRLVYATEVQHAQRQWELAALDHHLSGGVWCLALSADGTTLAAGGPEPVIRMWHRGQQRAFDRMQQFNRDNFAAKERDLVKIQQNLRPLEIEIRTLEAQEREISGKDFTASASAVLKGDPVIADKKKRLTEAQESLKRTRSSYANPNAPVLQKLEQELKALQKEVDARLDELRKSAVAELQMKEEQRIRAEVRDRQIKLRVLEDVERKLQGELRRLAEEPSSQVLVGSEVEFVPLPGQQPVPGANGISSLAFSSDGQILACGTKNNLIHLLNWQSRQELRRFDLPPATPDSDAPTLVALSPQGTLVAGSGAAQTIVIWDLASGRVLHTLAGQRAVIRSLLFSPDGKTLASAGQDGFLHVWEVASGKEQQRTPLGRPVRALAYSPDGKFLAAGGDFEAIHLQSSTGKEYSRLPGHSGPVKALAFSPDGAGVISGGTDGTIRFWSLSSGKELRRVDGNHGAIMALAVAPDGRFVIAGTSDNTLRIWPLDSSPRQPSAATVRLEIHLENGKPVMRLDGKPIERELLALTLKNGVVDKRLKLELIADKDVDYETVVFAVRMAKEAGVAQIWVR